MKNIQDKPIRVLSVFGTRPEAIKMAPLCKLMAESPAFESRVCLTGQHRDLPDAAMRLFGLRADRELGLMQPGQTPSEVTARALAALDALLREEAPDLVLVHGDTASTLAGALASFFRHIPVGHVEAGLRTRDREAPWPEEMNRTLTADLAQLHFCPTAENRRNLEREAVQGELFVTGNTGIDAMKRTVRPDFIFPDPALRDLNFTGRQVVLLTCHRRENQGAPMERIFTAAREIAERHEELELVCPVHPNPAVRCCAMRILGQAPRVRLTAPLDVESMHNLLARCRFVLTDSGGLQEEAPALGKPVLVLRNTTERPEALRCASARLVGNDPATILSAAEELLRDGALYRRMAHAANPYGDGHAGERIVQAILWAFGRSRQRPEDFTPRTAA